MFCSFAQLTAFVSYIYNNEFKNEFLCITNVPLTTSEEDIHQTIVTVFKTNDIKWEPLHEHCTGDASAMLGHSSGVYAYVKSVAPDCTFMHCMIHHETLASMTLGPELMKMQRHLIKLINTVKSSALNTCLF